MWSGSAITIATSNIVGTDVYGIFVDLNNTLYVANRENSRIHVWLEGNTMPNRNITGGLQYPYSLFVTINGDIYIDNGNTNKYVNKWTLDDINQTVMSVTNPCYGLFIDIVNNIYCSMFDAFKVVTKSLNTDSNMWIVAAGTDCIGSSSNQLNKPRGIFVDTDLNLYVADCGNNRVQKFASQQLTAITVAGSTASGTIALSCPSDVILDGDGYLFIVDSNTHRIVAQGSNGFRCIVGCSQVAGSSASQLKFPSSMKFDSYGNIYVTDRDNNRVQKFILIPNITYRKYLIEFHLHINM